MVDHMLSLAAYNRRSFEIVTNINNGDELAKLALLDFVQEEGIAVHPFKEGECYYIETLTLYWVGKCVKVSACWIHLEKASWVHWTGRKGRLMQNKSFKKKHFRQGERSPRTEFVGTWNIPISSITGYDIWPEKELPMESLSS